MGDAQPNRTYDKGERRFKHVGTTAKADIEFVSGHPRMWIGKCPNTLGAEHCARLVNEAVPTDNGDRDLTFSKKIYAVHDGVIYEGQTTDRGRSYHGYPYRGKLARGLVDVLGDMASRKGCKVEFDLWVKRHIEEHGSWA